MNHKHFLILFASLAFTFCLCRGHTRKSNHFGENLAIKRTIFKSPSFEKKFEKRSIDQERDNVRELYDYYQELEEPECPEGQFWHVRGLRCVPFDCPGGNQFRDKHTGDCVLQSYGMSKGGERGRQGRIFNSRMKSPTKFRLPFGLTLKG